MTGMPASPILGALLGAGLALCTFVDASAAQHGTRFWNLTGQTVTHLFLAPAGTNKWGSDQTKNDPDGSVDDDERLAITGVNAGHYDAKLTQQSGRVCTVRNVAIKPGAVFSIDKKALTDCKQ